jgi:hypothetical protein
MRTPEAILEEYRKGELYRRLNLYLQYRDLRCQFTQIDSDERALPQAAVPENKASRIRVRTGSIRFRMAGCFSLLK